MGALILKSGSKGKWVLMLQQYLNLKGKLREPLEETGEFDQATKTAVQYFQKTARLKEELDGAVGPETANALAKLVGSQASSFAKEFGELKTKADADEKEEKKKSDGGKKGKHGNTLYESGPYRISLPPDPAGKFPLLVLFGGTDGIKGVFAGTPASCFQKAIIVFSLSSGKFGGFQSDLKTILEDNESSFSTISICGYSLGGQGAVANYSHATKAVGFIDPTIYFPDFSKFSGKTIYSVNTSSPESWNWSGKDPSRPNYTCGDARAEAVEYVKKAGGLAEVTGNGHGGYPAYFLKKFESKLI